MIFAANSTIWFITHPLRWMLEHIHSVTGATWAWSIILLTFLVRLALVPLTVKQQQSMRRMQDLQPEIKKLQEKYRSDRQVLNQKMMELYRERSVNPFGSCLPIVVQIPVFIGLFYVLRNTKAFVKPGDDLTFLSASFVPNISTHLKALPTVSLVVLMVLYVGSQLGSTLLMPSTADPRQKYLFLALPLIFAVFIINSQFPAGLLLYWITTNLWTVGQAAVIRKYFPPALPPPPATPKTPARKAKPKPKPSGGTKPNPSGGKAR